MEPGEFSDNPFSLAAAVHRRPQRQSTLRATKLLCLVAACFVVTLVVGSQSQRWLFQRLAHDYESLGPVQRQDRLRQFAAFGALGVERLATALADDDAAVARTAYEVLQQAQNEWTILDRKERLQRHQALVDAIQSVAVVLPDNRTGWASHLLQQTLVDTVEQNDAATKQVYRLANGAVEMLSLAERAGPSILSDQLHDPTQPRRLIVKSRPLPVSMVEPTEPWPDGPEPIDGSEQLDGSGRLTRAVGGRAAAGADPPTIVARTTARSMALQPTPPGQSVTLRDIGQTHETSYAIDEAPATQLVESPLAAYDDVSVMYWLGSGEAALRQQAEAELSARGFDQQQITIATQIAAADVSTRVELVDAIARSDQLDPRPWLFMMLQDPSRRVKLHALTVLATFEDPAVQHRLRSHLAGESDTTVASRIRQALELR